MNIFWILAEPKKFVALSFCHSICHERAVPKNSCVNFARFSERTFMARWL